MTRKPSQLDAHGRVPRGGQALVRMVWLVAALFWAGACAFSFHAVDVPLARFESQKVAKRLLGLQDHLGSDVLLTIEAILFVTSMVTRLGRGKMSSLAKATVVACAASTSAYTINECVLKVALGVPGPYAVLREGAAHTIHWFAGSNTSSFPSGHMVLASSFVGAFARIHRGSIWPLSALLAVAATLLVAGNWHFLSDVIAGTLIGITVGRAIGKHWAAGASGDAEG